MATLLCPPSLWHSWSHQSRIWPLTTATRVLLPLQGVLSLWFGLCLKTPSLWAWSRSELATSWRDTNTANVVVGKVFRLIQTQWNLEPNLCVNPLLFQLKAFSKVQYHDGKPMVKNFRPVQPLNGRQVFYSGGSVVLVSSTLLMAALVMALRLSQSD